MSSLLEFVKNLSSKEIFISVAIIIIVISVIIIASKSENFVYGCYECDDYGCYGCDDYGCYECDEYGCYENFDQGYFTGQENFAVGCPTCGTRSEHFRFGLGCPNCL